MTRRVASGGVSARLKMAKFPIFLLTFASFEELKIYLFLTQNLLAKNKLIFFYGVISIHKFLFMRETVIFTSDMNKENSCIDCFFFFC